MLLKNFDGFGYEEQIILDSITNTADEVFGEVLQFGIYKD